MGILNTLPASDESIDSLQAPVSALHPWPASSAQSPEGQPSYPQSQMSESLMSVVHVETAAAAPEAKDSPEDRPLNGVSESHDKYAQGKPSGNVISVVDVGIVAAVAVVDVGTVAAVAAVAAAPGDVQPQRLGGWRLHGANLSLRLRHLFQKAGVDAERLYLNCDVGIVGKVSILVVTCIASYRLCGALIYALRDQDMVY